MNGPTYDFPMLTQRLDELERFAHQNAYPLTEITSALPPQDVVDVIAPEHLDLDKCAAYEDAMNRREQNNGGTRMYRVWPHGTELSSMPSKENAVPVVKCDHCGQWAARFTTCVSCGAPVD